VAASEARTPGALQGEVGEAEPSHVATQKQQDDIGSGGQHLSSVSNLHDSPKVAILVGPFGLWAPLLRLLLEGPELRC
jgi:hypothetical protein